MLLPGKLQLCFSHGMQWVEDQVQCPNKIKTQKGQQKITEQVPLKIFSSIKAKTKWQQLSELTLFKTLEIN